MYNFSKKQKILIGIILAIVSIILINYVYSKETGDIQNENLNVTEESKSEEEESEKMKEEEKKEIIVHVAGAVNVEGVVFLQEGDRVSAAIEKAGGTTSDADMNQVNLAMELEDGMKIYVPKKGEQVETEESEKQEISTSQEKTKTSKKITKKVNINTATTSELEELPGIGPSTAEKIVAHREENGKFKTIENIKDVSGIGDAKYNSIKDLISV